MPRHIMTTPFLISALLCAAPSEGRETTPIDVNGASGESSVRVPCWQPHDFAFTTSQAHDNPFSLPFSATVTGPDGTSFQTHGFHDGGNTWKVRISPLHEGEWSIKTRSGDPELDGKSVSFVCTKNEIPNVHGGLRIDPDHPHHFVYEDGARYFLMGYECDWLWALDLGDPTSAKLDPFLDKLAAHGFNQIIVNAYAHDTSWCQGTTSRDDYGPPPLYAWGGDNQHPDHSRFNLDYWHHYDRMMDVLFQRGIVAHIMIKVYNKKVRWPARGSENDDRFFQWMLARYAAYPNVVWDFSKEAHNEKDLGYKLSRFDLLREQDPYHRLLTNHDDNAAYNSGAYNDVLDFRSDQNHKNWHNVLSKQRKQRKWPVVNVEFGYEHGPKGPEDKTYRVVQPPQEVCRRAWEVVMAGGYSVYYYTNTAWDVIRPEETPLGYTLFQYLREFFEDTKYWRLEPRDDLVSEGHCLARPGQEYIAFLSEAKPFRLTLEDCTGPLTGRWYHPFRGEWANAGEFSNGECELEPPTAWGDGPVALHLSVR